MRDWDGAPSLRLRVTFKRFTIKILTLFLPNIRLSLSAPHEWNWKYKDLAPMIRGAGDRDKKINEERNVSEVRSRIHAIPKGERSGGSKL